MRMVVSVFVVFLMFAFSSLRPSFGSTFGRTPASENDKAKFVIRGEFAQPDMEDLDSRAVFSNGKIYVRTMTSSPGDSVLYVFRPDGTLLDQFSVPPLDSISGKSFVVLDDETVVLVTEKNKTLVFLGADHKEKARVPCPMQSGRQSLYSTSKIVIAPGAADELIALNSTGAILSRIPYDPASNNFSVTRDSVLVKTKVKGELALYDSSGGLIKKIILPKWETYSVPVASPDGRLLVGCSSGELCSYAPNHSLEWSYSVGPDAKSIVDWTVLSNGVAVFKTLDGVLYFLNPDGTLRTKAFEKLQSRLNMPLVAFPNGIVAYSFRDSTDHDFLVWLDSNGTELARRQYLSPAVPLPIGETQLVTVELSRVFFLELQAN